MMARLWAENILARPLVATHGALEWTGRPRTTTSFDVATGVVKEMEPPVKCTSIDKEEGITPLTGPGACGST